MTGKKGLAMTKGRLRMTGGEGLAMTPLLSLRGVVTTKQSHQIATPSARNDR